jgi:F0F1-type ATP synthase assembly protein I
MGDQENDQENSPGRSQPPTPTVGDLFWIGTACAISVVGGLGLGYLVDSAANTTPLFTFVGLAFGIVSAVLLAVHQLRQYV